MRLSVITITYNNLSGLQKTARSVVAQRYADMEWIVVDGGSTDGTPEWLAQVANEEAISGGAGVANGMTDDGNGDFRMKDLGAFRFVSEPDKGVYDAQNKGIRLAKGEFCFFLNAGDSFCRADVLERMMAMPLDADIVYGNEVVVDVEGKRVGYCKGVENPGFVDLYNSCMKHQATFIRCALFEKYGEYDSSLRICADWEWFFRVIGFHDEVRLCYRDVDVAWFEAGGISSREPEVVLRETEIIYNRYVPKRQQADYNVFMRYGWLRQADKNRALRFLLHIVMFLAKRIK